MRIDECLRSAEVLLQGTSDSPRLDAELLLEHVTGETRARFRTWPERELSTNLQQQFTQLISRRTAGEPIAYILRRQSFWSLTLHVSPAVLIPRPETELVVERALLHLPQSIPARVLDVGTGSGAIALAIATERPQACVMGTDISPDALQCARGNAADLTLRVEFVQADLIPQDAATFDVIVSNPPYIAPGDPDVARSVEAFEPHVALYAAGNGFAVIRELITRAPAHLRPGGWLILEHGWRQSAQVRELLVGRGFTHVRSHADLAGHERVTEAQWLTVP